MFGFWDRPDIAPEGLSAVDAIDGACNKVVGIGSEEEDNARDFFGGAEAFDGCGSSRGFEEHISILGGAAGFDIVAWGDGIDADIVGRPFDGEGAG